MSKNVLLISSTPRKGGNSDLLCDEFVRGAQNAGHKAEKIWLPEKKINYCTGCCACVSNQGQCVQNDDINEILKKVINADILVLATPVYFHSIDGQMKTFIDRACPIYTLARNKDVYFIISAAGGRTEIESTAQTLRLFTESLSNVKEKGIIASTGSWDAGGVKRTPVFSQAYNTGKNI